MPGLRHIFHQHFPQALPFRKFVLLISIPCIMALGGAFDPGVIKGPGQLPGVVGLTPGLFFGSYLLYILIASGSLKRNTLPEG